MFSSTLFAIEAVVGFGLLVFVHELGHFLAAKFQGIGVEAFSIGFGPCLKKKWGETEYRLSLIPLGGYVKLLGEEPSSDREPDPREFYAKPVGQRAIVLVAGVFMNIVFGFIFFILAYQAGVPVVPAMVGDVEPGSPAWHAGLQRGDKIVRINNVTTDLDFEDLKTTVILSSLNEVILLSVERGDDLQDVVLRPEYNREYGSMYAGIIPISDTVVAAQDAPLAGEKGKAGAQAQSVFAAGIQGGDRITSVKIAARDEPFPVTTPADFMSVVQMCGGQPVEIAFERDGQPQTPVLVAPREADEHSWMIGISWGDSNVVGVVRRHTWASTLGLKPGDRVIEVDGVVTRTAVEVLQQFDATMGRIVKVTIIRDGAEESFNIRARARSEILSDVLAFEREKLLVGSLVPAYPAGESGIEPGDRIVSVGGKTVESALDVGELVQKSDGKPVHLKWSRDDKIMEADVTPAKRWTIDVPWEPVRVKAQASIGRSFRLGARKSFQWIVRVYATLRSLIFRTISPKHLSGPVSIIYITYAAARQSMGTLLYFLAVISVNLGVVNLLPIPILDGGHLVFAALEKVRGEPVNERIRNIASYIGLAVMLSIFLLAFWNDIRNLFFG